MTNTTETLTINFSSVRKRILAAGVFLGDEQAAEAVAAQADHQLNDDPEIIAFAREHGISIDWLVIGEGRPMLDPERTRRHPVDAPADFDAAPPVVKAVLPR